MTTLEQAATLADLGELVQRFGAALHEKICAAEAKYRWGDAWKSGNWNESLLSQLGEHLAKGDPRDVAIYCAFAWHHGWSVAGAAAAAKEAADKELAKVKDYANRVLACVSAHSELLTEIQNAVYAITPTEERDALLKPVNDLLLKRYVQPVAATALYGEGEKLGLPEAMPEPEPCINCQTLIAHDAPAYQFRDGEKACEACAPTWAEDLESAEEAVAEGGVDPDEDDVAWRDRVRAKIAAGVDPNAKAVSA